MASKVSGEQGATCNISIAEYNALRNEIVFRLTAQQNLINYSLVLAGILPATLSAQKVILPSFQLMMLLVGPLAAVFLQLVYLKHHVFIAGLATYIKRMGADFRFQRPGPFSGWEEFLDRMLQKGMAAHLTGALGAGEALIPSVVGISYVVAFVAAVRPYRGSVFLLPSTHFALYCLDITLLAASLLAAVATWLWVLHVREHALDLTV